jgi:hypothetical protein
MKILCIITTGGNLDEYLKNILFFKDTMQKYYPNYLIDYACISSTDNFTNLDKLLNLKYKEIDSKKQLSKICNFITKFKDELDYDWFIKLRPEVQIFSRIDFEYLPKNTISARVREYLGPKKIMYGNSTSGPGWNQSINDCKFSEKEENIVLDDQLYVFDKEVIKSNAFDIFDPKEKIHYFKRCDGSLHPNGEHEWVHTNLWKERKINLNLIGIQLKLQYSNGGYMSSGNVNC